MRSPPVPVSFWTPNGRGPSARCTRRRAILSTSRSASESRSRCADGLTTILYATFLQILAQRQTLAADLFCALQIVPILEEFDQLDKGGVSFKTVPLGAGNPNFCPGFC